MLQQYFMHDRMKDSWTYRATSGDRNFRNTNQGLSFLGSNFSNRDNVRVPFLFRRQSQPSMLKDSFSSTTDSSIFNSIQAISYPTTQCLVDQIKVQKPILVFATEKKPDHT